MVESNTLESAKAQVFDDVRKHYGGTRYSTDLTITNSLRFRYPDYTTTVTPDRTGILAFAKAGQAEAKLDTTTGDFSAWRLHNPVTDRSGREGTMNYSVSFGKYDYKWNDYAFIVYQAAYFQDYTVHKNTYILSKKADDAIVDGHSKRTDELIAAASQWSVDLHNEVWVFDQEMWSKNAELWSSVQESTWEDVILDDTMKKTLVEDVEGFFDRKDDYKQFGVPWKRGIIFHGIPGNGKTISIKALMHFLSSRSKPVPTLYVKSLAGCHGPHYAIRQIFVKARETAPCLLVFEDLDSLITDQVKSFFLNEVDGLESNDGIMMIGSTNYRKSKLSTNKSIDYPPSLSAAVAEITDGFSFAYLKESFITSLLVTVAAVRSGDSEREVNGTGSENADPEGLEHNALWRTISKQVETLRTEMEDSRKSAEEAALNASGGGITQPANAVVKERC
ncbi:MAG: hypothetical protein Q9200_005644 [Gallowayella weberi]